MTGTVTNNACNYSFNCNSGYNYSNSSSGTGSTAAGSCPASVISPACSGNIINLDWTTGSSESTVSIPAYCTYGELSTAGPGLAMTPIQQPTKTGYTFNGWNIDHVSNP